MPTDYTPGWYRQPGLRRDHYKFHPLMSWVSCSGLVLRDATRIPDAEANPCRNCLRAGAPAPVKPEPVRSRLFTPPPVGIPDNVPALGGTCG